MKETTLKALQALVSEMADEKGYDLKSVGTSHSAQRLHGDTGLFAVPGLERDIVTAHIRSKGIVSEVPWLPSVHEDPRFGAITGVSDDIGTEPTDACEDAPTGYTKACNLTARFGMIRRDTEDIDIGKTMLKLHRGDPTDLILRGRMLGLQNVDPSGLNEGEIMNIITMSEMVNTAVRAERLLNNWTWQGAVANQNEFPGLDDQIATGQTDADTGTACPAIDSYVDSYDLQEVDNSIVDAVSDMEYDLTYRAMMMGLDPASWVICMRPDMWKFISDIWPIAYNTNRGAYAGTNSQVNVIGDQMVSERDSMRRSMTIDINGNTYPVVVDTGIYEHNSSNNANLDPGQFASSIYMVPLTITQNFPVTYFEYVDFRAASPDTSLLRGMEDYWWTDQGKYSWAVSFDRWCFNMALRMEPRIVLRTPHLSGRLDSVMIAPRTHLRDSDPDSSYWADGGISLRQDLVGSPNAIWG